MAFKNWTFQNMGKGISKGASSIGTKLKANWQASQERARQQAIQDKAIRDEAKAVYQAELEKERKKAIQKVALEKAKLDAKLQAQKMFAPKQNAVFGVFKAPGDKVNQDLNASLNALMGTPTRKKEELKKSLKSKMKKGTPKSSFDDLIWKY